MSRATETVNRECGTATVISVGSGELILTSINRDIFSNYNLLNKLLNHILVCLCGSRKYLASLLIQENGLRRLNLDMLLLKETNQQLGVGLSRLWWQHNFQVSYKRIGVHPKVARDQ
jgi:hypothetical protein